MVAGKFQAPNAGPMEPAVKSSATTEKYQDKEQVKTGLLIQRAHTNIKPGMGAHTFSLNTQEADRQMDLDL